MREINETLHIRDAKYGGFNRQAAISQHLKHWAIVIPNAEHLTPSQRESLEMILHKISRITCGDSNYIDSWRDIAGYAQLIVNELSSTEGAKDAQVDYVTLRDGKWVKE